jgi:uncharacterized protein (DUF2252 family)
VAVVQRAGVGLRPDQAAQRHGRMLDSPTAYLRGAVAVMARDLGRLPSSGIPVQLAGDAHLSNFGLFATADGEVVFDLEDFDETLAGPFEWDLKRLAVSLAVAARQCGFDNDAARSAAGAVVVAYRNHMAGYAAQGRLDTWYARIDDRSLREFASGRLRRLLDQGLRRARRRAVLPPVAGLTESSGGRRRLAEDPPVRSRGPAAERARAEDRLRRYCQGLPDDRRHLLAAYRPLDVIRAATGVGALGSGCDLLLLAAGDDDDLLLLELREPGPAALESVAGDSRYGAPARRVVEGQRLLQAADDPFLDWNRDERGRDFYVRHHRELRGLFDLDRPARTGLVDYGRLCGWALARAHARSGDPVAIVGYLGSSDRFARAVASFAVAYAEQVRRDHTAFVQAVEDGRLEARLDA